MIEVIEKIVCEGERLTPLEIHVKSRETEFKEPRQIIMYLARQYTNMSQKKVGEYFDGLDHATINNAEGRIKGLIDTNRFFRDKVNGYKAKIENFKNELAKIEPDLVNLSIIKGEISELELELSKKKTILVNLLKKLNIK